MLTKMLKASLLLYVCSLPLSIAGMEITSWLTFLLGLILMAGSQEYKDQLKTFCFRPLFFILPFVSFVIVSALVNSELSWDKKVFIVGEMRWIFLISVFSPLLHHFRDSWPTALKTLAIILGALGIYSTIQVFTGIDLVHKDPYLPDSLKTIWRAKGFFDIMTYSYAISTLSLFLLAAIQLNSLPLFTKPLRICSFCVFLSLILTFTRGMWLSLFVSALIITALVNFRRAKQLAASAFSIFVGLALLIPEFRHRIINTLIPNDYSSTMRIKIWHANWEMFLDHPFFGVGFRQNVFHIGRYFDKIGVEEGLITHAHSNYFALLAGTGLPGLLFYLFFIFSFLLLGARLWKQRDQLSPIESTFVLGALGAMLNFHIGGLTEATFYDGEVVHIFVFSLAILTAINSQILTRRPQNV